MYALIVLDVKPLNISQETKDSIFSLLIGKKNLIFSSFWQLIRCFCTVLYELQVDLDNEKFATLAICSHIPNDSPVFSKDAELNKPFGPYFDVPIFGLGQNVGPVLPWIEMH